MVNHEFDFIKIDAKNIKSMDVLKVTAKMLNLCKLNFDQVCGCLERYAKDKGKGEGWAEV